MTAQLPQGDVGANLRQGMASEWAAIRKSRQVPTRLRHASRAQTLAKELGVEP